MLPLFFFIFVLCTPIGTLSNLNNYPVELRTKYGGLALNSLKRLLNFFESDPSHLNLDGLYGLRIAEGQLIGLKQSISSQANKEISITDENNRIHSLLQQIERIANSSLKEIENQSPEYLHRFFIITNKPFTTEYLPRKISKDLIESGERSADFDEDESDHCFADLLGSSDRPNIRKCSTSNSCWNMMTAPMTKDYRLTHQLLWLLTAKTIGCVDENRANKRLNHFEDKFCSNIYEDAKVNLENNINQDLFLEQLLLCSIVGYEEFLRIDWLNTILSWQHPNYDCFSDASETIRFHRHGKRHLLVEQEMNNGCLSHKSGLAAGLLATYTRSFLQ